MDVDLPRQDLRSDRVATETHRTDEYDRLADDWAEIGVEPRGEGQQDDDDGAKQHRAASAVDDI